MMHDHNVPARNHKFKEPLPVSSPGHDVVAREDGKHGPQTTHQQHETGYASRQRTLSQGRACRTQWGMASITT